jgi:mono/diheme cytochrome c family protein
VQQNEAAAVAAKLPRGANYHIKDQTIYMPAFAAGYTNAELSAVANYVFAHFSGQVGRVTPQDIAKQRAE